MTNTTELKMNSDNKIPFGIDQFRLKYQIDIVPLLLVLTVFAVQFSAFFICKDPISAGIVALALLLPQCMVSSIVHNHSHVAIFRGNIANRVLNILLYLETGMMVSKFHLHHNCGHHCFYKDPTKDTSNWVKADGSSMGRVEYILRYFFTHTYKTIKLGQKHPHLLRRYYQELVLVILALTTLLLFNPINGLILFMTPIILVWLLFINFTYDDHINLHSESDYGASHSKTNYLMNLLTFNAGYHLAHHLRAGLHWSELPEYHEEIEHKITVQEPYTFMNRVFK